MESLEILILQNLFYNPEYFSRVIYYVEENLFTSYSAQKIAKIVRYIFEAKKEMATPELVKVKLDQAKNLTSDQYKEILEGLELVKQQPNKQPIETLVKCTEEYFRNRKIKLSLGAILDRYASSKSDISGEYIKAVEDSINYSFDEKPFYDYMNEFEHRLELYSSTPKKYPFPLKGLNIVTNGGMGSKSLVVAMATTGGGKSIFLCNAATYLIKCGYNVLYITCEMAVEEISKRIDANLLSATQDSITKGDTTVQVLRERMNNIDSSRWGNLVIKEYPAGCATAGLIRKDLEDIERTSNKKIDVLVVDYINLLATSRYSTKNANTYTLVKAVAEELRALGQEFDIPVISATQSNRSALNRETKIDMGLEAVSESFGLPQTADFMFNIIDTDNAEWQANHYKLIKILKNRWGDPNKKYIKVHLDTRYARFSDVDNGILEDKPNELVKSQAGVDNENVTIREAPAAKPIKLVQTDKNLIEDNVNIQFDA